MYTVFLIKISRPSLTKNSAVILGKAALHFNIFNRIRVSKPKTTFI